jgi:hypothetical protein
MMNARLPTARIRAAESLRERIVARKEGPLSAIDTACSAITDFELDFPITVDRQRSVADAFNDMVRLGIHALLVTREGLRGIDPQIVGLITARQIQVAFRTLNRRSLLTPGVCRFPRVCDVMTSWDELSVVSYDSLRSLTARDLYETFQGTGLTHLLVVDVDAKDIAVVRGVLSRANLAERLRLAAIQSFGR